MIKRNLIILGIGLMVVGLLLMYFTKNMKFAIVYFPGILLVGICIVMGFAKKKGNSSA